MTALVALPPRDAEVTIDVLERDARLVPRLVVAFATSPSPRRARALKHTLTAAVEHASADDARWDVTAIEGPARGGRTFVGVELALDTSTFPNARAGERMLELVAQKLCPNR